MIIKPSDRQPCRRILPLLAVFCFGLPSILPAQTSLADVAKREEQRRKAVTHPSKVYTNADLRPSPDRTSPSAVPTSLQKTEPPAESTAPKVADEDKESRRSDVCQDCERDADGDIRPGDAARRAFMRLSGFPGGRPGWVVDHIQPLACGGADDPSNMRWQTKAASDAKDKTLRIVCPGDDLIPTTPLIVPIIIGRPIVLPPSCGGNTAREQANANFTRDAGVGGATAPLPPCTPPTAP